MKTNKLKFLPAFAFVIFLAVCFAFNLFTPDRAFSDNENRELASMPKPSVASVVNGKFESGFETYITDQFFSRDGWVALKSLSERLLGKTDLKGVFICSDGSLIERFDAPDADRVKANAARVEAFAANAGVPVCFTLIPGPTELKSAYMPANAQNADQKALIDEIYALTPSALHADTYSALAALDAERVYYKTDHHWTSYGAYTGASALLNALGLPNGSLPEPFLTAHGFYGTTASKAGWMRGSGDDVELRIPDAVESVTVYDGGDTASGSLYDMSKLDAKDKYQVFLGGNYPRVVIKTGSSGGVLLLIKDSYANSEIPFLCADFSEIHVLDLRYYKLSLAQYIAENGITQAVVSYSVPNFTSDTNLVFITK